MKNLTLISLFSLSILLNFFSSPAYSANTADNSKKQRQTLPDNTKNEILNVLQANEILFQAFFDRKQDEIKPAATKLNEAIEKISDKEIKKKLVFSQKKLQGLNTEKTFDENSQDYHLVSMALIHILDSYDIGSTYNAYYCPMVKKKWVQNSDKKMKVHNPYASDMMPHCGEMISHY